MNQPQEMPSLSVRSLPQADVRSHMVRRNLVIVERRRFPGRGDTQAILEFRAVLEGMTLTTALLRDTSFLYAFEGDPHAAQLDSMMASRQRFQIVE